MAKLAKQKTGKQSGNITVVDLGEDIDKALVRRIDQKMAAVGLGSQEKMAGKEKMAGPGYKAGGYRPGMFGFRPWYADKQSKYGHMMGASYSERMRGLARPNLTHLGIGAAIGAAVNVALLRVTPDVVKSDLSLVHTGIGFVAGLAPVLIRPNSYTLGVAIPGTVALAMSLFNYALDTIGIKKPALRGSDGPVQRTSIDAALAARQKLADVHGRMNRPVQASPARVTAQAVA